MTRRKRIFAHCLTDVRLASGLTLSELARRAGVSRQLLTKWETGITEPRVTQFRALLEALEAAMPQQPAFLVLQDLFDY